ncbi:hypothetical protein Ccrd_020030, partial [Cynara cardunculus var. scolymus]
NGVEIGNLRTGGGGGRSPHAWPIIIDFGQITTQWPESHHRSLRRDLPLRRPGLSENEVHYDSAHFFTHMPFSNLMLYFLQNENVGCVQSELRCPQRVGGIIADPQTDWSFDELLSEIIAVDQRFQASSLVSLPFTKTHSWYHIPSCSDLSVVSHAGKNRKSFVMHVSMMKVTMMMREIIADPWPWVVGLLARNDDADFDNKSTTGAQWFLMDEGGVIEGALIELSHEHQITVAKKRNLPMPFPELKRARRHDVKALDNHLTDIQRHHEYKS